MTFFTLTSKHLQIQTYSSYPKWFAIFIQAVFLNTLKYY